MRDSNVQVAAVVESPTTVEPERAVVANLDSPPIGSP